MRTLKQLASSIFGGIGSGIGLIWAYVILSYSGDGCSCGWQALQALLGWPMLIGGIIGVTGSSVYFLSHRIGGILLFVGAIFVSPFLWSVVTGAATGYWPNPILLLTGIGFLFFAPSLFAGLLLFLGGLLSFAKTRHIISSLHHGGWIP